MALHGSYRSIVENSDLPAEVETLAAATGERPRGSRQHWLRFDHPAKLFSNIEKAGLQYDSSWGWAEQLGFRHGAAFAFPPYNFAAEAPYNFLLIPLVIMDRGLQSARHEPVRRSSAELAESVLAESRRWGWGGVSVLWHNPVEPLSACDEVNQIFWQQVRAEERHQERWISAEKFMDTQSARAISGLGCCRGWARNRRPGCRLNWPAAMTGSGLSSKPCRIVSRQSNHRFAIDRFAIEGEDS